MLLLAAAALAALGALREAAGGRFPIPQSRRQVPERWHHALPLPVWSAGYGAGLGAGVFTFQPVATFPVLLVGAVAVGDPVLGAFALGLHGAGRLLAALPAAGAIDLLAPLVRPMRLVNAVALAGCAVALLVAGASDAQAAGASTLDPSVLPNGTLAVAVRDAEGATSVEIRPPDGAAPVVIAGALRASLDGRLAAVEHPDGIAVVRWQTGEELTRLAGWSHPALRWPWLVGQVVRGQRRALVGIDLVRGTRRVLGTAGGDDDLGRPSIAGGGIVLWHVAGNARSRILRASLQTGRVRVWRRSRIALLANPAARRDLETWVEQRLGVSRLYVLRRGAARPRLLLTVRPPQLLWTTATDGTAVWVTRWNAESGASRVVRLAVP